MSWSVNFLFRLISLIYIFIIPSVNAASIIESANESINLQVKYQELAKQYQAQADYYNGLAGIYESNVSYVPLAYDSVESSKPYNPFVGSQIGLGGGSATGNTVNTNFSGSLVLNYNPVEGESGWNFNTIGQYDYLNTIANSNEKNRLYLQQNATYMFDKYNGTFAQGSYLNDVNDGYIYVYNENIGYQLQLLKNKLNSLAVNFGPGAQQRQVWGSSYNETQPQFLSQLTYNLNLSNILTFYEQLQNTYTQLNTTTYSISQLNLLIAEGFSIGINYQLTYNSKPSDGTNSVTTISSFQINYGIN
jgi:putative salt-induced outer membrane protein YdiY